MPWTTRWIPALVSAAISSVDLVVIITIIKLLEKPFEKGRVARTKMG
jgi:hypothetical protein